MGKSIFERFVKVINGKKGISNAQREVLMNKLYFENFGYPEEKLCHFLRTFNYESTSMYTNFFKPLIRAIDSDEIMGKKNIKIQMGLENEYLLDSSYDIAGQYANGILVRKNIKKAIKYYIKATEEGDYKAYFDLALIYFSGYEIRKDKKKAFQYLLKGVENNYESCFPFLAYCYLTGNGTKRNIQECYKVLDYGASKKFTICLYIQGFRYAIGAGVVKSMTTAYELENEAEEQGYQKAAVIKQLIVNEANIEASKLCTSLQKKEIQDPKIKLAAIKVILNSDDLENRKKAFEELQELAKENYADAQYELGILFYYGNEYLDKNKTEAFKWWKQAAENGNIAAEFDLGSCYIDGEGTEQDKNLGLKLWISSAEKGDGYAMLKVGALYCDGVDLPKDLNKGIALINKARELNVEKAEFIYQKIIKNNPELINLL